MDVMNSNSADNDLSNKHIIVSKSKTKGHPSVVEVIAHFQLASKKAESGGMYHLVVSRQSHEHERGATADIVAYRKGIPVPSSPLTACGIDLT